MTKPHTSYTFDGHSTPEEHNVAEEHNALGENNTNTHYPIHANTTNKTTTASNGHSPLISRDFVLLVSGQGISLFANLMLRFAMSMWVLDETGSATIFASILAVSIVPMILLSPFGGVLADRVNRRTIMVALDACSAMLVLTSAIVFITIGFSIVAIAVMQVLLAVLGAFETPTVQAALPQMYRRYGSAVVRQAMAVVNQVQQIGSLLPSFLGGVLYAMFGIHLMMTITIASFAIAATLECFIHLGAPDHGSKQLPTPIEDLKAGVRFLLKDRPAVFQLLLFAAAMNFIITGYAAVGFPYTIRTVLGFNATVYGVADGLVGVAGLVGAFTAGLAAAKLTMRHFPIALFMFSLTVIPQAIVFILPANAWVKLAVLVTFTCCTMIACSFSNLIAIPTIQMSTPEAMTGKVMAMTAAISMCAQPLGQMVYGWAYDHFPVAGVLAATAIGSAVLIALTIPLSRQFDE